MENAFILGCYHLTIFQDSKLTINMIKGIYNPSNKLLKRYTQASYAFIFNFMSFNIIHIRRELNSMANMLTSFVANPSRQLLSHRLDCIFLSLQCYHLPNNLDSLQVFTDDESICASVQNKPKQKNISLDNHKFPKGMTPLEN